MQQLVIARLRWRPHEADAAELRGFAARYPDLPAWEAMLAALEWDLGNPEGARRGVELCAADDFRAVVRSPDFLPAAANLAEAAAGAGDARHVSRLYELLAPHAHTNPVFEHVVAAFGPAARPLGLLAAADDRPADAAAHFADAVRLAGEWGAPAWALRSDRRLAGHRRPGRRTDRRWSPTGSRWRASSGCRASPPGSPTLRRSRRSSR